jgi:hypothetical protein
MNGHVMTSEPMQRLRSRLTTRINWHSTHIMDDIWVQPKKVAEFYSQPVYRFNLSHREIRYCSGK